MAKSTFEDIKINIRIKLSALWTSLMFCYLYGDYFELYVPQKVEGLLYGTHLLDSPLKLFAATVMMTVPSLMIFVTLILKPRICRILNIAFGMFFTLVMLLIAATSLTPWRTFYVFLALVECLITIVIIVQAWKWQKIHNIEGA